MQSETNQQRSVEEIGHERDTTREALDNLLREQQELEEQRRTLLDDESLMEAAMSSKPLGARSSMRKVLDRLAAHPCSTCSRRSSCPSRLSSVNASSKKKEAEPREALALGEEALAAKWEAEEKFDQAGNISHGVHHKRDDRRRALHGLRQQLATLERNKPEIGGGHRG